MELIKCNCMHATEIQWFAMNNCKYNNNEAS